MNLTSTTTDQRPTPYTDEPLVPQEHGAKPQPPIERWLEVMYGIRPNPTVRATFVPITHAYTGAVADWLEALWDIRPGRSYPRV